MKMSKKHSDADDFSVSPTKVKAVQDALMVMVLTPHILAYLQAHDPMALKQAKEALIAVGANTAWNAMSSETRNRGR